MSQRSDVIALIESGAPVRPIVQKCSYISEEEYPMKQFAARWSTRGGFCIVCAMLVASAAAGVEQEVARNPSSMCIIRNDGQLIDVEGRARPDVFFTCVARGARLFFRRDGISYVFARSVATPGQMAVPLGISAPPVKMPTHGTTQLYRVDMKFVNARTDVVPAGLRMRTDKENFYLAHCPEGVTGVPAFEGLIYRNAWPGIDVSFTIHDGRLKSEFIVHAGGNPRLIGMSYMGATDIVHERDGTLSVTTPLGSLVEHAPVSYQYGRAIATKYSVENSAVSFALDDYDTGSDLIIDPWSTYYGGSLWDEPYSIRTDASGNVYMSGIMESTNFPMTTGAFQTASAGGYDCFLVKFNTSGQRLWATYYGGSSTESLPFHTLDAGGNICMASSTASTDFPVTQGAFQFTSAGSADLGIVKFTNAGIRLWATYCGGTWDDFPMGVAADAAGDFYFTGQVYSTNFPVTAGAFQTTKRGGTYDYDLFILKMGANGARHWATYYGGSSSDWAEYSGITADAAGNTYVTGVTYSNDFPVTPGAFQTTFGGREDAYLVKFGPTGTRIWATYYGGSGEERSYSPHVDVTGAVYFVGYTTSSNFPVSAGALQTTLASSPDAYVVKMTSGGARVWATFYGGGAGDSFNYITSDPEGYLYITGGSSSTDFPVTAGSFQTTKNGSATTFDAVAVKFDAGGARLWGTYLGGADHDFGLCIARDNANNLYVAGQTTSTNFPVSTTAFQQTYGGGLLDCFLMQGLSNGIFGTVKLNARVYLAGSWNGVNMNTLLNSSVQEYLPAIQPYAIGPFLYDGTESVATNFFASNRSIVDWILVELRTGTDSTTRVARRSGFLKSDGSIVDVDGTSPLSFLVASGSYFIVIRHRNHLKIMSASALVMTTAFTTIYDFTTAANRAYTTSPSIVPQKQLATGKYGLYSGDGNADGGVNAGDQNAVWRAQFGNPGYLAGDFNLDGSVNAGDINSYWRPNNGVGSQVP
jgi:hypothetical protein